MQCPIDGTELVMSDRSGVEIDYCPKCRGVWLDRGELDKIIERSAPQAAAPTPPTPPGYGDARYSDPDYRDAGHGGKPYRKKKRGSFLEDIFDF